MVEQTAKIIPRCKVCGKDLLNSNDIKDGMCSMSGAFVSCLTRFLDYIEHTFYTSYDVPDKQRIKNIHKYIQLNYLTWKYTSDWASARITETKTIHGVQRYNPSVNFKHFSVYMLFEDFLIVRGERPSLDKNYKVYELRTKWEGFKP